MKNIPMIRSENWIDLRTGTMMPVYAKARYAQSICSAKS